MNNTTDTITIPADIAKALGDRSRQDLERAAKIASDLRKEANECRKRANSSKIPVYAADMVKSAESLDHKADRWDAEFNALERICIALTRAGA